MQCDCTAQQRGGPDGRHPAAAASEARHPQEGGHVSRRSGGHLFGRTAAPHRGQPAGSGTAGGFSCVLREHADPPLLLHQIESGGGPGPRALTVAMGTLTRSVGSRLGRHLARIVPLFLQCCGDPASAEEAQHSDAANEMRESCFPGQLPGPLPPSFLSYFPFYLALMPWLHYSAQGWSVFFCAVRERRPPTCLRFCAPRRGSLSTTLTSPTRTRTRMAACSWKGWGRTRIATPRLALTTKGRCHRTRMTMRTSSRTMAAARKVCTENHSDRVLATHSCVCVCVCGR